MQLFEQRAVEPYEPLSILVVDDSRGYRHLLVALLQQWNYSVAEADNGQQALTLLAQKQFNIVITDWEMPHLDGLALCQAIRQQKWPRYLYVILLTAHDTSDDLITGLEAGADDFLAKPLNQGELRARLHAAERVISLEAELAARNETLWQAYQKMEEDLQAAALLQRTILPNGPLREGNYIADFLFLPSDYLSGDIFNLFTLGRQHLGFYSIDVAGHGVGAAMLSLSVARQFLHGRVADHLLLTEKEGEGGYQVKPPHQVVQELNRRFCRSESNVISHFTLVY
ncbi:MAG: response regulator, partial [Enterobacteriaceae bacterium]